MASRRQWHLSALTALVGAALLAACGGGGDSGPTTTRVVIFGDSLSDLGAYSPATSLTGNGKAPYFGGRFTTNTHTGYTAASNGNTATIWVEWVATRLGVAITPNEAGFGPKTAQSPVTCPAAVTVSPVFASSCTGYAQGGSRVTSPAGIGNPNGNGINGTSPAPMTLPMTAQMDKHLQDFTGYSDKDIVFVYGGNNDIFILFGGVGAGQLTPTAAIAAAQATAGQLATLVKDKILAKGATRVAVMNLPDASATPAFAGLPAASKGLLSSLSAEFNTALLSGLSGTTAQIIDARALSGDAVANPGKYGLTNVTTPVCDPAKISAVTGGRVTDGSSLFCNAAAGQPFNGTRTGSSTSTWLFADGVHPTSGGHKLFADQVIGKLKDFGWMPLNQ